MNLEKKRRGKINLINLLILFTIVVFIIRFLFFSYKSGDYLLYLKNWVQHIRENGGILSLKEKFTDYNLPYLTILTIISYIPVKPLYTIKIVSIIFDLLMAITGYKIVNELCVDKKNKSIYAAYTYIALLLAPTIILNSATWGQCDSIYTFFVILSIYYLIKEKYVKSFIFLGVAFSFKLQFIFILPLYIILFFRNKNIKLTHFFILPLVNFILCIPGMIVGCSPFFTYSIYYRQTGIYSEALNVINIYNYLPVGKIVNIIGIIVTMLIFGALLLYCIKRKIKFESESIISLGLLSILICYFFLPCMHDRYMYMADAISIIWFFLYKRSKYIPLTINLCSFITYLKYLAAVPFRNILYLILPIFLFIAIIKLFLLFHSCSKNREV